MGWVVLTLRKTELKRTHADYQMELLQISRTKRQMARQYHYEQMVARNNQSEELRALKDQYTAQRDAISSGNGATAGASGSGSYAGTLFGDSTSSGTSGSGTTIGGMADITSGSSASSGYQLTSADENALAAAREDYQYAVNEVKTRWEDELAMIEQEANDVETDLDQQQVEIEAQLEAISQEIEAVGQAISSQIQASTIKLS